MQSICAIEELILILLFVQTHKCSSLSICQTGMWQTNGTIFDISSILRNKGYSSDILLTDLYIDNNDTIYLLDSSNYHVIRYFSNSTVDIMIRSQNAPWPIFFDYGRKFNILCIEIMSFLSSDCSKS